MRKAIVGAMTVHANQHQSRLVIEGVNPNELVAIGFQSPNSVPRQLVGETFTNAHVFLAGPRVEHLANVMPGQHTMQILLPAKVLEMEIAARLNRDPYDLTGQRYLIRLGKRRVGNLIALVNKAFRLTQDWSTSPAEFALSAVAVEQAQKALLEELANALVAEENALFHAATSFSATGWILL